MFTSIDTSMSLLSPQHAGQDLGTTAVGAAGEALKAIGDQIGAKASPAWLRVASLATDAWLSTSGNTEDDKGLQPTAKDAKAETPYKTETEKTDEAEDSAPSPSLDPIATMSVVRSKNLSIISEDMLISAIITFNQTLKNMPDLQRQLKGYQADMNSASDERMIEYLKQKIAITTESLGLSGAILAASPAAIEDGLEYIKRIRNVTGTVYTRGADGTFTFGQFLINIVLPGGGSVTWSHDGSGVAVKTTEGKGRTDTQAVPLS